MKVLFKIVCFIGVVAYLYLVWLALDLSGWKEIISAICFMVFFLLFIRFMDRVGQVEITYAVLIIVQIISLVFIFTLADWISLALLTFTISLIFYQFFEKNGKK